MQHAFLLLCFFFAEDCGEPLTPKFRTFSAISTALRRGPTATPFHPFRTITVPASPFLRSMPSNTYSSTSYLYLFLPSAVIASKFVDWRTINCLCIAETAADVRRRARAAPNVCCGGAQRPGMDAADPAVGRQKARGQTQAAVGARHAADGPVVADAVSRRSTAAAAAAAAATLAPSARPATRYVV